MMLVSLPRATMTHISFLCFLSSLHAVGFVRLHGVSERIASRMCTATVGERSLGHCCRWSPSHPQLEQTSSSDPQHLHRA